MAQRVAVAHGDRIRHRSSPLIVRRSQRVLREYFSSLLVLIADRDLTVHTYDEKLAEAIFGRIPRRAEMLRRRLQALEQTSA